jgi:glyoxylase-like metal-dependent hydrolase (beta-lactamase superfamily II)
MSSTPETHSFSIGAIKATVISDGLSEMQEDFVLSIVPQISEAALDMLRTLPPELRRFSLSTLYLEIGDRRVLIDTGLGEARKPESGHVLDNMRALGISPDAIDTIFITHFHGDHFAGLLTADGQPVFPNAQIFVRRTEHNFWMENPDAPAERVEVIRPVFTALAHRVHQLDDGQEVAPGVRLIAMPGHTPGHTGLMIESEGQCLLHLVDSLHMAVQFAYPELSPRFDSQPEISAQTRRDILARAADENLLTLAYHLPFPGLGRVTRSGDAFAWTPDS